MGLDQLADYWSRTFPMMRTSPRLFVNMSEASSWVTVSPSGPVQRLISKFLDTKTSVS